jgi:chorismate dehydratase
LNTKPLLYGFEKGMLQETVQLTIDHPGNIATALLDGAIDIGLIPVAILPQMNNYFIVSDYGIAADGAVASVCLFSEVPLEQIKTVLLDYQSRTSVQLVQYLFKNYWKKEVVFKNADIDFLQQISGTTAAVVIGDRAFEQRAVSSFMYDLGKAWKLHTGLPFVFAAWVSNKPMSQLFITAFNNANQYGLQHLQEVVAANPYPAFDLYTYYTQYIQYKLDDAKLQGMQLFLDWCKR